MHTEETMQAVVECLAGAYPAVLSPAKAGVTVAAQAGQKGSSRYDEEFGHWLNGCVFPLPSLAGRAAGFATAVPMLPVHVWLRGRSLHCRPGKDTTLSIPPAGVCRRLPRPLKRGTLLPKAAAAAAAVAADLRTTAAKAMTAFKVRREERRAGQLS